MAEAGKGLKKRGGWMMVLGVLQILGGIFAIAAPFAATGAVAWILGCILIVVGLFEAFSAFRAQTFWSGMGDVLGGILYLIAGAFILMNLQFAMILLGTLVAIFLIARGVLQTMASFQLKPAKGWGWVLFGGLLAILLGVLLMMKWPLAPAMAVGIFIGIELIFSGWTLVFLGGDVRDVGKRINERASEA